jgi:hypothetical protein
MWLDWIRYILRSTSLARSASNALSRPLDSEEPILQALAILCGRLMFVMAVSCRDECLDADES